MSKYQIRLNQVTLIIGVLYPDFAINPSGGLKSFGHPIGSTGCRMVTEVTKQLQVMPYYQI